MTVHIPPEAIQWAALLLSIMGALTVCECGRRILDRWELMRRHRDQARRPVMRDWSRP